MLTAFSLVLFQQIRDNQKTSPTSRLNDLWNCYALQCYNFKTCWWNSLYFHFLFVFIFWGVQGNIINQIILFNKWSSNKYILRHDCKWKTLKTFPYLVQSISNSFQIIHFWSPSAHILTHPPHTVFWSTKNILWWKF